MRWLWAGRSAILGSLTLSKTADPATSVLPGELITYTLTLDAGNRPITSTVTLADALPEHTSFVGASDGGVLAGRRGPVEHPGAGGGAERDAHVDRARGRWPPARHADRQRRLSRREWCRSSWYRPAPGGHGRESRVCCPTC